MAIFSNQTSQLSANSFRTEPPHSRLSDGTIVHLYKSAHERPHMLIKISIYSTQIGCYYSFTAPMAIPLTIYLEKIA